MTTAVADIADLVKILREQPEWAETLRSVLLSKELLEMPEKLAQLTARFEEFVALQTETNQRVAEQLAQLTEQVSRLTTRLEEFIAEQKEINRRVAEQLAQLTAQVSRLTTRLEEFIAEQREINRVVAERLTRLETDMAEVKADTAELKVGLRRLEGTVGSLQGTVGSLAGTVGRLQGAELERKIHANIAGMVCTPLGIRRPRVLKSILAATVPELFDLLDPALDDGRISRTQFDSLMQTDIILAAREGNAQPVYVAIEISRTVHDEDLDRARERADILAAASGVSALALVIGYIIPPPQRRKAAELAVHLMETASLAAAGEDAD